MSTPDTTTYTWVKSSKSQTDWRQQCVEIGAEPAGPGRAIRDSVHPDDTALPLTPGALLGMLAAVR